MSQAAISRYEQGIAEPTSAEIQRFAQVLRVDRALLGDSAVRPAVALFRSTTIRSAKLKARVKAKLNLARMGLERLLDDVEIDSPHSFPSDLEFEDPRAAAAAVRQAWRVPPGPVENVTQEIERTGGLVVRADFGTDKLDALYMHPVGGRRWFFVNTTRDAGDRVRFSMAHELGHALFDEGAVADDEREADARADLFASAFLMPSAEIVEALNATRLSLPDLLILKRRWGVSVGALLRTAVDHGLMSPARRGQIYVEISRMTGSRTVEPESYPLEQEQVMPQLLRLLRTELGYSEQELAQATRLELGFLTEVLPDYFRAPRETALRLVVP